MKIAVNSSAGLGHNFNDVIHAAGSDIELLSYDNDGNSQHNLAEADVFIRAHIPNAALERALSQTHSVKWFHTASAGVDSFWDLIIKYVPENAIITNSSGTMSLPIAEYCMAQIYSIAKQLPLFVRMQDRHTWEQRTEKISKDVCGANLFIIGLGSIGSDLAKLAAAAGMHVQGVRRTPASQNTIAGVDQIWSMQENWQNALAEADYVVISAPLTPETYKIINKQTLSHMKSSAWLINIARGALVDENALIEALEATSIGGAALDVAETEPLPESSALWRLPNALITPHISWMSPKILQNHIDLILKNIQRYREGQPLLNIVSREYRY